MTSNAGTEYINLKKAKYNRDMREKRVNATVQRQAQTRQIPASERKLAPETKQAAARYNRPHGAPVYAAATSAYSSHSAYAPTSGETLADGLLSDIADSVGKAIAAKRKAKARERASEAKYVKKSVKAATPFPISVIGYMVVFAAIAMFLVLGNTKINEATLRADALKSAVAAETERSEQLTSALSQRRDIGYIEDYAENVLGMVKSTDVAKHYVNISGEDKIAVNGVGVNVSAQNEPDAADMSAN